MSRLEVELSVAVADTGFELVVAEAPPLLSFRRLSDCPSWSTHLTS